MTGDDRVLYSVANGVAHLQLNRPRAFNALDLALARGLDEMIQRADRDPAVRVLLLTGAGRAFCAGGDIRWIAAGQDAGASAAELAAAAHRAVLALARLEKPVVAAVHGSVAGGGLGLCCSADLLLAGESTRFVAAYAGIGVSPDCSVSWSLPRIVGARRALQMTLLNRPLPAGVALDWGLVTAVHPDDVVLAEGRALAERLAAGPALSLGRTRRLIRDSATRALAPQLDIEAASVADLARTQEARDLIGAFVGTG